jgi:hypothetical protein
MGSTIAAIACLHCSGVICSASIVSADPAIRAVHPAPSELVLDHPQRRPPGVGVTASALTEMSLNHPQRLRHETVERPLLCLLNRGLPRAAAQPAGTAAGLGELGRCQPGMWRL